MTLGDHEPRLTRVHSGSGPVVWTDLNLRELGVVVAFSERSGGHSALPYASLNLASHVGDSPARVDANRDELFGSLGIASLRSRLVTAEQVHGDTVTVVDESDRGRGAFASGAAAPMPATDALVTSAPGVPLLMLYADCVPVVLVAPGHAVCVVHAGWRGALSGIAGSSVRVLSERAGCDASEVLAYIGPHVGSCCYVVGETIMSQFTNSFGTVARAQSGGLDLEAVVRKSLTESGVSLWRITSLGVCTAEETERFFSYRAEGGTTGRHGALACVLPSDF